MAKKIEIKNNKFILVDIHRGNKETLHTTTTLNDMNIYLKQKGIIY